MSRNQAPPSGRLVVVSGASQSGKTHWTMQQAKQAPRCLVWDPEDQWSQLRGFARVTSRPALLEIVCTAKGPARLAYVAGGDLRAAFDFWAGCAFYWGRYCGPCTVVAEELSDVSTAGKAPGKWGILLRRGLKRGITIYAISQRWAEADKTAIGNASRFVIFRSSNEDTLYLSRKTGAPVATLGGLRPRQHVEIDALTGKITAFK